MTRKKWWLWIAALIAAAAVVCAVFMYAGRREQSPGATLVMGEEAEILG